MNEIALGAANSQACIAAVLQAECENATNFIVELNWNNDPTYSVNFQQHSLSIICLQQLATTACQSCVEQGGISPVTPTGTHNNIVQVHCYV